MNIDNMTIKQARELAALFCAAPNPNHAYPVGEKVFVRTVTHHHTGRLVKLAGAKAAGFCAKPDAKAIAAVTAVLLHGPDAGLLAIRRRELRGRRVVMGH